MTTSSGILTSPSYPGYYPYEMIECVYLISVTNATYLNLTMHMFDLDKNDYFGYFEIKDGDSESSPRIGKFLGSNIPKSIQTTQGRAWIK